MAALATAANEARGLAMDSIAAAHSGHMGLPLGCAEVGAVLYGSQVRRQRVTIRGSVLSYVGWALPVTYLEVSQLSCFCSHCLLLMNR